MGFFDPYFKHLKNESVSLALLHLLVWQFRRKIYINTSSEPTGFLSFTLLSTRLKAVEKIENPFVPVMDYHDKSITADIKGH